ncbi:MAG: hypothetical protein ACI9YE_000392 [Psychroserpens sp.]|jgi:hypothetical protein
MGYKNRGVELLQKNNNLKGWKLLVKFGNELDNLISENKIENKVYLESIISQINGKFINALKYNKLSTSPKYNRVWNQCMNGCENVLKKPKSLIKYNLLSHHTNHLVCVGKSNVERFN